MYLNGWLSNPFLSLKEEWILFFLLLSIYYLSLSLVVVVVLLLSFFFFLPENEEEEFKLFAGAYHEHHMFLFFFFNNNNIQIQGEEHVPSSSSVQIYILPVILTWTKSKFQKNEFYNLIDDLLLARHVKETFISFPSTSGLVNTKNKLYSYVNTYRS